MEKSAIVLIGLGIATTFSYYFNNQIPILSVGFIFICLILLDIKEIKS